MVEETMDGMSSVRMRTPLERTLLRIIGSYLPFLLSLFGEVRLRLSQRKPDLSASMELKDLDRNLVALVQHIFDRAHALIGDLGNVQQPIGAWHDFHERAEVHDLAHHAIVNLADLGLCGNRLNGRNGVF